MAQNLEYRGKATDGQNLTIDSLGTCPGSSRDSCSKYGRLYTWTEAMGVSSIFASDTVGLPPKVVGICPSGWHVPSILEWESLQQASGGASGATSLKATGGWNFAGSDRLGMRILPAGYEDGGVFHDMGVTALFWPMDEYDGVSAWNWYLYESYGGLLRGMSGKSVRFSVRCVMDSL